MLASVLDGGAWREREGYLSEAYTVVAALHNGLSLVASGIEVVIVDGAFWDEPDRLLLLEPIAAPHQELVVTLVVPFDEALRRVQLDPTRRDSRNPTLLARNHTEFHATLPWVRAAGDMVLDTTQTPPAALAETVAARLPALFGSGKADPG